MASPQITIGFLRQGGKRSWLGRSASHILDISIIFTPIYPVTIVPPDLTFKVIIWMYILHVHDNVGSTIPLTAASVWFLYSLEEWRVAVIAQQIFSYVTWYFWRTECSGFPLTCCWGKLLMLLFSMLRMWLFIKIISMYLQQQASCRHNHVKRDQLPWSGTSK